MTQSTNIFRVLIKTLLKAGIITERTRPIYAAWVDMDELKSEDDAPVAFDVVNTALERMVEQGSVAYRVQNFNAREGQETVRISVFLYSPM